MKAVITNIQQISNDSLSKVPITVSFSDNDRNQFVRSVKIQVFLDRAKIKHKTLTEISNIGFQESYEFLNDILKSHNSQNHQ